MEYSIIIEKNHESGVYCGQCVQLPEAISQGKTVDELMKNMKEAIDLAIEFRREDFKVIYKGRKIFHRKLTVNDCQPTGRQKGSHAMFKNNNTGVRTVVPLHNDIDDLLAKKICKQLWIPIVGSN